MTEGIQLYELEDKPDKVYMFAVPQSASGKLRRYFTKGNDGQEKIKNAFDEAEVIFLGCEVDGKLAVAEGEIRRYQLEITDSVDDE